MDVVPVLLQNTSDSGEEGSVVNINDPFGWARPLLLDHNNDSTSKITSAATLLSSSSKSKSTYDKIGENSSSNSSPTTKTTPPTNTTPTTTPTATGLRLDFGNRAIDAQEIPNDGILVVVTGRASLPHRHCGRPRPSVQCFTLYDVNSKGTASSGGTSGSGKKNRKR